jgi:hypothetical protein
VDSLERFRWHISAKHCADLFGILLAVRCFEVMLDEVLKLSAYVVPLALDALEIASVLYVVEKGSMLITNPSARNCQPLRADILESLTSTSVEMNSLTLAKQISR